MALSSEEIIDYLSISNKNNKMFLIEEQNKWYEKHKSKLGDNLALILSGYRYKKDIDGSIICDPIKHVIQNPPSITAICLELGNMNVNDLRTELGYV